MRAFTTIIRDGTVFAVTSEHDCRLISPMAPITPANSGGMYRERDQLPSRFPCPGTLAPDRRTTGAGSGVRGRRPRPDAVDRAELGRPPEPDPERRPREYGRRFGRAFEHHRQLQHRLWPQR